MRSAAVPDPAGDPIQGAPRALSDLFVAHLPGGAAAVTSRTELETALQRALDAARERWPDIPLATGIFVPFLAARVPASAAPLDALREMQIAELHLVCAFLQGDVRAAAALEAGYLRSIDGVLARIHVPAADVPDVRQIIYQKLLLPLGEREPKIARYAGRGTLLGWLRVVATREARDLMQQGGLEQPVEIDALLRLLPPAEDAELGHLKEAYRSEREAAFREAFAALSSKERNVLRYHLAGGLNIDRIGALYGVHRATVARWIAAIREKLLDSTREGLMRRLAVGPAELDSILRLIDSRIEVSLSGLLTA